jgi:hypothetical protein
VEPEGRSLGSLEEAGSLIPLCGLFLMLPVPVPASYPLGPQQPISLHQFPLQAPPYLMGNNHWSWGCKKGWYGAHVNT